MEPRRAAPGEHSWRPRVAAGAETAAELVYHLAGALGTELQELARRFGPEAAAGLVPLVVRALELLEKAAVGPAPDSVSHRPSLCHPRGRRGPNPESPDSQLQVSAQQAELELRRLRDENEHLRRELRCGPQEERALLRQLKEVTDRQRDELRAHNRDLQQRSQETEALQEQLQRLLLVNAELRHKLAAVQTQLRAARDRESERELRRAGVVELAQDQARNLAGGPGCAQRQEPELATAEPGGPGTPEDPVSARWVRDPSQSSQGRALGKCAVLRGRSDGTLEGGTQADAPQEEQCPSNVGQCGFSRQELQQILQERNELKANVFLLKEELAYFQRELLTDHRVPGLLLEAMKVAVRKQRKKIKAKMLGTPEEAESSDDEDGSWLLLSSDKEDHPPPPDSRIQSFFGRCYRGGAEALEAKTSSTAPSERGGEEEAPQRPHVEPVGSP
ncbi:rab-interacting lysosomal protein isoform X2 [Myotis myotis]|uniref:rab-interacting lysosomal protein isoform X2 n=1 Tax=Myotis myotis TaxID=51298 RepID=UPI00174B740F|nr:rab-interacting lysosomal protein isoform X2 [Myotis myotis]